MNTPVTEIKDSRLSRKKIQLFLKRDDLIHPDMPGNKFRKLKYNLRAAQQEGHTKLLTFGGAYSNHVHAVAAAGAIFGYDTIGIIRGEEYDPLNPTLSFAVEKGMKLHYVSRKDYRKKYDTSFLKELESAYGPFYMIPEGGSNEQAVRGCAELIREIDREVDVITACCGTGGTLAGIIAGLGGNGYAIGFPVLRNGGFLSGDIDRLAGSVSGKSFGNWHLETDWHFGGYAKYTPDLIDFILAFKKDTGITLDPVYTGKMMYAIFDLAGSGFFRQGTRILAIHTGGLQGIRGFNERFGTALPEE